MWPVKWVLFMWPAGRWCGVRTMPMNLSPMRSPAPLDDGERFCRRSAAVPAGPAAADTDAHLHANSPKDLLAGGWSWLHSRIGHRRDGLRLVLSDTAALRQTADLNVMTPEQQ